MSSGIKNISAVEFNKILNSPDRASYQIIDVREKDELAQLALHGDDVINLPLSQNSVWGAQVINGEILDANKPVLCMCKAGGRSMKAASFLGKRTSLHRSNYIWSQLYRLLNRCAQLLSHFHAR